jgi:hypothetical protein
LKQRAFLSDIYRELGKPLPEGWKDVSVGMMSLLIREAIKERDRKREEERVLREGYHV